MGLKLNENTQEALASTLGRDRPERLDASQGKR
jgi:hypothetical protein